jgi:hypothetical protein
MTTCYMALEPQLGYINRNENAFTRCSRKTLSRYKLVIPVGIYNVPGVILPFGFCALGWLAFKFWPNSTVTTWLVTF